MLKDKCSPDACVGYAKRLYLYPQSMIPCSKGFYHWIYCMIMKTRNLEHLEKISRKRAPNPVLLTLVERKTRFE